MTPNLLCFFNGPFGSFKPQTVHVRVISVQNSDWSFPYAYIGLWPPNLHLPLHCIIVVVVKVRLKGLFQKMLKLGGKIQFIEQSDLGKFKD